MTLAHSALKSPRSFDGPFGAIIARPLSVWPFAVRTMRLFLLVEPSLADRTLREGLLKAMQRAYFASDGYSQTRAVREAALAAHYVLRHHNHDVLPLEQVKAASAVAAVRGDSVFVALAGDAAAFAWRDGELTGQRGIVRLPRPLGLDQDPPITLWSTPLLNRDRLVLVCGARLRSDASRVVADVLSKMSSPADTEQQLAEALGSERPAGVLVVDPPGKQLVTARHLWLVPPAEAKPVPAVRSTGTNPSVARQPLTLRRWLTSAFGVALLTTVVLAALRLAGEPPLKSADPMPQMAQLLVAGDRVDPVSPAMAVKLGPSAVNVVDLAVGNDALYTLDVGEGSVREFGLGDLDQQPTPNTLVAQAGASVGSTGQRLGVPVAIQYLTDSLVVIDESRTVFQVDRDRSVSRRSVPTSTSWLAVGALGSDPGGRLVFVDSAARRLLLYPPFSQRVIDPPRVLLDSTAEPSLPFERVAEVVGVGSALVARTEDGGLVLIDVNGGWSPLVIRPSDGRRVLARSIASDRVGGLYVADPANSRILQVGSDGSVLRQLRDAALGGVRQIQSSRDGRTIYGLVASGVLVFDTPDL